MRKYFYILFLTACSLMSYGQQSMSDSLQNNSTQSDSTQNNGQDPNYLVADADQDSVQKFHVRASIDGMASTGNIERVLLQFTSNFDWKPVRGLKLSSSPSFVYGQQNKLLYEREFFTDFRATIAYQKPFYGLILASWERSNLRQINNRWVQAAGVGYKLIQRKQAFLSITNLILHESTDYLERTDLDLWRNSTRLLGEFALSNKVVTRMAFLYQPSISQKNNIRWSGTFSIQYQLNKSLSFRTKFENTYESYVVSDRKNNDFRWTMGIAYEL